MHLFKPNVKKLEEKKDIAGLIKALKYPKDEVVRTNAASALANLGAKEAIPALKESLEDESYHVYLAAIGSLGRMGETELVERLVNVYLYPRSDLPKEPRAAKTKLLVYGHLEDLREVGPVVVPYLLPFLEKDIDINPLLFVAHILAEFNETVAVPKILSFFERFIEGYQADAIITTLLNIGEPAFNLTKVTLLDQSINIKNNKKWFLKRGCIRTLAAFNSPQAVQVLIQFLEQRNNDYYLVNGACDALKKIGDRSANHILGILLLEEGIKPSWLKIYAAALGTLGGPTAVNPLLELMDAPKTRYDAVRSALVKIGADSVQPLLELALNEDEEILKRTRAISALGSIGDERAAKPLLSLKEHENKKIRDESQAYLNINRWPGFEVKKPKPIKPRKTTAASPSKTPPKERPPFPKGMPAKLPPIKYVSVSGWQDGIGPGEEEFIKGRDSWSAQKYPTAVTAYKKALKAGLTPLYEAGARMNLGKIYIKQKKITAAVEEFKKVLMISPQQPSSAYDSATYLALIYEVVAMSGDSQTCIQLAKQAMQHVNYTVSASTAREVQSTTRKVYNLGG